MTTSSLTRAVAAAGTGALLLLGTACERDARPTERIAGPAFQSTSSLPHINITSLPIPVTINADFSAYDCSNNPGPQITFSGGTFVGGYGVAVTFTNNMDSTHSFTGGQTVKVSVQPASGEIVIPKQPVLGGTGGNPFIFVQFVDGSGSPLTNEIFLGRCVQGAGWHVTQPAVTSASASAEFTVTSCTNSPGPDINFTSEVSSAGLSARIIFRNAVDGPHQADVTRDVTLLPVGLTFTIPKQPVLGGVGGNPWIWAGFTDSQGTPLGTPTLLGRCVQLSQVL
jgi:hypothetical protein